MEKRKIILDCDPGHDDAIAIMMAAKHQKRRLVTVFAIDTIANVRTSVHFNG